MSALRAALTERIPGGASWRYVFGSGLLFAFSLQVLTGLLLAFQYSPSATDAWGSVYYIQHRVALGWLVRGLHHFGSSAMVVLAVMHMVQVFVAGAYKAPREVNWLTGVLLLGLVLGFALTGYLLPWDQKGYWATRVATNIMGGLPVIGEPLQTFAQGGPDYGNLTLTRFYALHVFVLPLGVAAITALHVVLMRRHGVTPPASKAPEELERTAGWFWPSQVLMDLMFSLTILGVLLAVTLGVGAPLDAPADPSSDYDARPEWYFLFLFQLLKFFEGPLVLVGTVVLPGLASVFLVALPFMDRSVDRRLRARKLWAGVFFGGLAAVVALTVMARREDAANEAFQQKLVEAGRDAREALHYAADSTWGIDGDGRIVLFEGRREFRREKCTECHIVGGSYAGTIEGQEKAPTLDGYLSREWIHRFLQDPSDRRYFGLTRLKRDEDAQTGMPSFASLGEPALTELTEHVASLSGEIYDPPIDLAKAAAGRKRFEEGACSACHTLDGTAAVGPSLKGYGSRAWLTTLLQNPAAEAFYGEHGAGMPPFDHLSGPQVHYLTAWLANLKEERASGPR